MKHNARHKTLKMLPFFHSQIFFSVR